MNRVQNVNDTADHRGVTFNESMKQKRTKENRKYLWKAVESGAEEQSLGLASLPGRSWLICLALCSVFAKTLLGLFSVSTQVAKAVLTVIAKVGSY